MRTVRGLSSEAEAGWEQDGILVSRLQHNERNEWDVEYAEGVRV